MSDSQRIAVLAVVLVFGVAIFSLGINMVTSPINYGWLVSAWLCNLFGPVVMFVGFVMTFGSLAAMVTEIRGRGESIPEPLPSAPPLSILDGPVKPAPKEEIALGAEPKPRVPLDLDQPIVTERECPNLIGLTGGLPNKVAVPVGVLKIGRDKENDLVLSSQLVSRHHAEVEWNGEVLTVRDLGSGNKTRVNDEVIEGEYSLQDGDVIQIVDYNLEVELPPSFSQTLIIPRND